MSETAFEHDFLATPDVSTPLPGPLRARPLGVRAALGMGGAASAILLCALVFVGPRHESASAEAPGKQASLATAPAAPAPEKISAKIEPPAPQAQSPFSAFDLNTPAFAQEKKTIAARDGEDGAGRVDAITIGQFAAGATFMRVDVHQNATEKELDADFFLDMNRHASQLGLNVARINPPGALPTRFGAFEAADMRLTQPAGDNIPASERNCVAARLIDDKASLVIAGIACGSASLPIDRSNLGCLLDGLDYAKSSEGPLADFFAKAQPARAEACDAAPEVTGSLPHKARPHGKPGYPKGRRHR